MYGLTIRQLVRELVAAKRVLDDAHNRDVRLAWHIELLQRQKALPKLSSLMVGVRERPRTPEQQRATLHEVSARVGLPVRRVRLIPKPVVH